MAALPGSLALWHMPELCSCPPACKVIQKCLVWGGGATEINTAAASTPAALAHRSLALAASRGGRGTRQGAALPPPAAQPRRDADTLRWVLLPLRSLLTAAAAR